MGARIRAHDWASHPLGDPIGWPTVLRVALGLCLTSSFPTAIYWGPELRLLYNDAWSPIPAHMHPRCLGRPAREVWAEIWEIIGPQLQQVIATGQGFSAFDQLLPMRRGERIEETYWNYSFTPLLDEQGAVAGVFNQGNETTEQVLARRARQAEVDHLRELFQQAPGGVAILRGSEHVFEFVNPAYQQLIGDRDPIGKRVVDVLPEVVEQGLVKLLDRVFSSGQPLVGHAKPVGLQRNATPREEVRLLDFVFQPIKDGSGYVNGIFVQVTDVTERSLAEKALRVAHENQNFVFKLTDKLRLLTSAQEIMQTTSEALGQYLRADRVGFSRIIDDDTMDFGPQWTSDLATPLLGRAKTADFGVQANEIVRAGKTLMFSDATTDARFGDSAFLSIGAHAAIAVPMIRGGRWQAAMHANQAYSRAWTDEEIALVEEVAQLTWDAVERSEAAAALRVSEERLQLVLSASNTMGTWDWDIVNHRIRMDANLATMYGVDPIQAVAGVEASAFVQHVHPDDGASLGAAIANAVRTGEHFSFEYRVQRGADRTRWVVAQGNCIYAKDGTPLRFAGVSFDVTDLKRAQAAEQHLAADLAAERTRLQTLVEHLPIGVCFIDANGKVLLSNPAYRQFMVNEQGAAGVLADVLQGPELPVAKALRGEAVPGVELRSRSASGAVRWVRASAVPLLGAGGVVSAVLSVLVDIDEQKRAQETLQRLNASLESEVRKRTHERDRIWHVSEDLLGVADASGVWLNVNPGWTRSLGWEAEELLNKTTEWLEIPESETPVHVRLAQLRDGEAFSFESRLRSRGAEPRVLSWRGVRIDGLIYSVARDVTEKRLREQHLDQIQEQLRQSQKMEAVGQLTGGIAHDFNNLLTGIIGSLDMLQRRLGQGRHDSVDKYANAAISSANRAAALTHRLLAFSRRQPLDPRPVAANSLLTEMEDMLRRTMGEKVDLEISTAAALWLTRCDPNQLENAVLNLAINARDAMPHGGRMAIEATNASFGEKDVAAYPGLKPGQYVGIAVCDTGIGMPPEVLARAYEPFFTTKPMGQGTGLGLSMIYGFAKQSDGYTCIESELGAGTTVRIFLPRYLGELATEEAVTNASGRYRAPRLRTVLVVEDELVVRNLVVEVLSDLGYHVIETVNGRAGLEVLMSEEVVDLVISDVGLPELNGRDMIARARERRPTLKVLFITGYAENMNFGANTDRNMQLITKPFSLEALAQRIREMIGD